MPFAVDFTPQALEHLKALRKRDQQILIDAIAVQLVDQPNRPTRNRKRLEENTLAPWELRVRQFRVFYDVDEDGERVVILAVGKKEHNKLFVGGEEIEL
jgi:mRNA-degrading endonuclease RelE of RelBE toxin-antitoxin system